MSKIYIQTKRNFIVLTISDLKQSSSDSVKSKINWARIEEADNFAKTVKTIPSREI